MTSPFELTDKTFAFDTQWRQLMADVLTNGVQRPDRTGTGTYALFGRQLSWDMRRGFPAVTTKKLYTKQMWAELAAFIRGHDDLDDFQALGCSIWDEWDTASYWQPRQGWPGHLGRIYGVQWRDWTSPAYERGSAQDYSVSVDQLAILVDGLQSDPYSRRHLVTAWNPGELDQMCLPPCHVLFQCFVEPGLMSKRPLLSMRVDMRSVDLFIGLPFDVASYGTLLALLAKDCDMVAKDLVFQLGDAHVYCNHVDQVREVCGRQPFLPPALLLDDATTLFNFHPDHAALDGYDHHPALAAPVNV